MIRFLLPASIPINPNVANELWIGSSSAGTKRDNALHGYPNGLC